MHQQRPAALACLLLLGAARLRAADGDGQALADRTAADRAAAGLAATEPFREILGAGWSIALDPIAGPADDVRFTMSRPGFPQLRWQAWAGCACTLRGERAFIVVPQRGGQGGEVRAVDLRSGAELWRTALRGLPPIGHSKYANHVALSVDDRFVTVVGDESAGRYVEVKDADTGDTVGHAIVAPR